MAFNYYIPFGKKKLELLTTSTSPEVQLWQEMVMFRHLKNPKGIFAKKASAAWIDQAKTYYIDACNSDWRTAGLLYYYSFLNLTKAFLASKKAIPARTLKSESIYHGLTANPQSPKKITDFELRIHPPVTQNRRNLFSTLYEQLTGVTWPHRKTITIQASSFLPYCREIISELKKFYGLNERLISAQSLIRDEHNSLWFEVNVPNFSISLIESNISNGNLTICNYNSMNGNDFFDWFNAFKRPRHFLLGSGFIRTKPRSYKNGERENGFNLVVKDASKCFSKQALPLPTPVQPYYNYWHFVSQISLAGKVIYWHPLLSDYLFAFVLSTILRYHPHLIPNDSQASFTAEAWCNQSATTVLRYFLMEFTNPSLRIKCK